MESKESAKIKVCDLVQAFNPISGGEKRYITDKINYISARSDIEHILIVPGYEDDLKIEGRTKIYQIKSPHLIGSKMYRVLLNRRRMLDVIAKEKPDVIEVSNAYRPAWVAIEAGIKNEIPVVGFYHSDFPRGLGQRLRNSTGVVGEKTITFLTEKYLAALYNRMTVTVTSTKNFRQKLHNMGVNRVVRIPLGTNTEVFYPRHSKEKIYGRFNIPRDAMLLLFVGRLAWMKKLDKLLAMMDEFKPEEGNFHLLLIGDGELWPMVKEASATRRDISWQPFIADHDFLAECYSAADLLINPSLHETFGLVSIEAQACGTRVLGVRGGGMDETLEEANPHFAADNPEPQTLAEAVHKIRALPENEELQNQRRQRIIDNFSVKSTFDRLIDLYSILKLKQPLEKALTNPQPAEAENSIGETHAAATV